ncbi:MAG: TIGR03617 family F420-dependent LLM class oxidoreductase [Gammaproteobacteria bacterium]|nr:TIGR03617 family F420-dependent LLM class oxidoreductase [Gammaproteobacteria bacterium]
MKVWATADFRMPYREVGAYARRAEALGFDGIKVADQVSDGFLNAAAALGATSRIQVCAPALVAFARSPMIVAIAAWDLRGAFGERFELGLGPQVRGNIVRRYSGHWVPPAPRMREYVRALRAIFDCWQNGTPLHFEGRHYSFTRMQEFVKPPPIEHPDMPIIVAGIGPLMTAVAGEVGDALATHPTNVAPRFIRERALPQLERGATRAGRSLKDVGLRINCLSATGVDERATRESREALRSIMATLFSTPSYWPILEFYGWQDRGAHLNRLVREGRWRDLPPIITDEMLDTLIPAAPYGGIADVLRERYESLADNVSFALPADPALDPEVARVVSRLHG